MATLFFAKLSSSDKLLHILGCLSAVQNSKVLIVFTRNGLLFPSASPAHQTICEGFLGSLEFDIFTLSCTEASALFDLKSLKAAVQSLSANNARSLTLTYPYKSQGLLLHVADSSFTTQFVLRPFEMEPQPSLELSSKLKGTVRVKDYKLLKQLLEVVCHGKHEAIAFVTFDKTTMSCSITKDDVVTGVKSRVTFPHNELVECEVFESAETIYPAKTLSAVSNFPKAEEILVHMHNEGHLVFEIILSDFTWFKYFVAPTVV